jgi:hypothetical protein
MPIASSGNVITASAQLGADVVLTTAIKDGEIVNADIGAGAAIVGSKIQALSVGGNAGVIPSTGVENAHIAAGAAIADTKLAQITTANKVSGAALTSLGSIPAGAGVIPAANVPASSGTIGVRTYDLATASGTQTIAHGLGRIPVRVFLVGLGPVQAAGTAGISLGGFIGGANKQVDFMPSGEGSVNSYDLIDYNTDSAICLGDGRNGYLEYAKGSITVDATNIYIAWTKVSNPTGAATILWEAS